MDKQQGIPVDPALQIVSVLSPMNERHSNWKNSQPIFFSSDSDGSTNFFKSNRDPSPPSSSRWTNEDIELLLEWFSSDLRNFELYKTKAKDALSRVSRDVFGGRRSPSAIKGKWDSMKDKHRQARARLQSTGEGELDDLRADEQKWESIQLRWLSKLCPYFEELDDILQRDKSYTPYYVSESGGQSHLQLFNGSSQQITQPVLEGTLARYETEDDLLDESLIHPPVGDKKSVETWRIKW